MAIVDNSPEARLKRLQEKGMDTGTAAQNLQTQIKNEPILPAQSVPSPTQLTPSTTPGITPGAIAPKETPTETPKPDTLQSFKDATAGQDVQFRQTYRESLKPDTGTTPTPTETPTGTTAIGLTGAMKQAYDQLTPYEQKTYDSLTTQGVKAQTDYLQKVKSQKEYSGSQEDIRLKMQQNTDRIEDIQSEENLAKALKSLNDLKQNVGYLGMGGSPGKSSAKLDAITQQVNTAQKTYNNIVEVDRLARQNRELGHEANAAQFQRQMQLLQDDLDSKVNKTIQNSLNEFSAAELAGKLDTIPEIEAFQQQLYAQLDGDISSIADTNIEARKFLLERYDALAESQKKSMEEATKQKVEYEKRANTVNEKMSQAKGYYVNENGDLIRDEITGQAIPAPPESKFFQNQETGEVSVMTPNRDGTYSVSIHKIGTPRATTPEWKQDASGNWYNANSSVSPGIQTQGTPQGLLDYISNSEGTHGNYNAMYGKGGQTAIPLTQMTINQIQDLQNKSIYQDANGNYVGGAMGKYQIVSGTLNGLKQRLGLTGNELFDEEMQDKMAMSLIGNSYADYKSGKITADQLQNKVSGIWAGVPNTRGVSTYAGDKTNRAVADNGAFLQAVGKPGAQTTGTTPVSTLGQFLKDNQNRGPGYSEEDVKAFNSKIDRYIQNGDEKGMAIAFRQNLMNDKDFKKEFDDTTVFTKALDNVQSMINEYEKAGKSTNALTGMAEKIARKIGVSTDTALAQLQTQMGFTLANYIRSISGTAASDVEVQRLMGNMANISNVKDLNTAIVSQAKTNANAGLKQMIDNRMYGMPEELKPQVFGDVYTTEKKAQDVKKKLGGFSLSDILSNLK